MRKARRGEGKASEREGKGTQGAAGGGKKPRKMGNFNWKRLKVGNAAGNTPCRCVCVCV